MNEIITITTGLFVAALTVSIVIVAFGFAATCLIVKFFEFLEIIQ